MTPALGDAKEDLELKPSLGHVEILILKTKQAGSWRVSSAVKSTVCSCRGPEINP